MPVLLFWKVLSQWMPQKNVSFQEPGFFFWEVSIYTYIDRTFIQNISVFTISSFYKLRVIFFPSNIRIIVFCVLAIHFAYWFTYSIYSILLVPLNVSWITWTSLAQAYRLKNRSPHQSKSRQSSRYIMFILFSVVLFWFRLQKLLYIDVSTKQCTPKIWPLLCMMDDSQHSEYGCPAILPSLYASILSPGIEECLVNNLQDNCWS